MQLQPWHGVRLPQLKSGCLSGRLKEMARCNTDRDGPTTARWFRGSFGGRASSQGPRDRAPSAYLRFSIFVFRLPEPLFNRERECGASIWSRPRCRACRGSTRRSATSFLRRSSVRRCGKELFKKIALGSFQ